MEIEWKSCRGTISETFSNEDVDVPDVDRKCSFTFFQLIRMRRIVRPRSQIIVEDVRLALPALGGERELSTDG